MKTLRTLTVGLLVFMAGWGLGWDAHMHRSAEQGQSAQSVLPAASQSGKQEEASIVTTPMASGRVDGTLTLLQRNDFDAVMDRYEALQLQADEAAVADARIQILAHTRQLIADRRFILAEQLLQHFLVAAYRDVEARILLAAAYHGRRTFR